MSSRVDTNLLEEVQTLQKENDKILNCYIPRKNDKIDESLAEFVNHISKCEKSEQMKIMFLRESEGVYKFGSKRVFIKVDKGNVQVRVGGGFMKLQDFLEEYSEGEVDKILRNDAFTRFQNQVEVHKESAEWDNDNPGQLPIMKIKTYHERTKS